MHSQSMIAPTDAMMGMAIIVPTTATVVPARACLAPAPGRPRSDALISCHMASSSVSGTAIANVRDAHS